MSELIMTILQLSFYRPPLEVGSLDSSYLYELKEVYWEGMPAPLVDMDPTSMEALIVVRLLVKKFL